MMIQVPDHVRGSLFYRRSSSIKEVVLSCLDAGGVVTYEERVSHGRVFEYYVPLGSDVSRVKLDGDALLEWVTEGQDYPGSCTSCGIFYVNIARFSPVFATAPVAADVSNKWVYVNAAHEGKFWQDTHKCLRCGEYTWREKRVVALAWPIFNWWHALRCLAHAIEIHERWVIKPWLTRPMCACHSDLFVRQLQRVRDGRTEFLTSSADFDSEVLASFLGDGGDHRAYGQEVEGLS